VRREKVLRRPDFGAEPAGGDQEGETPGITGRRGTVGQPRGNGSPVRGCRGGGQGEHVVGRDIGIRLAGNAAHQLVGQVVGALDQLGQDLHAATPDNRVRLVEQFEQAVEGCEQSRPAHPGGRL
jgi:hypothetical protein